MEAQQVRPPASWSWFSGRRDVTVPLSLLSPGSPTSVLGPWSTATAQRKKNKVFIHVRKLPVEQVFGGFLRTHQWAEVFHLLAELVSVFLLFCLNPSLHLGGFGMFSSDSERRLPCGHLINQTAEAPPVRTHPIMLVADHLGSCRQDANQWTPPW